MSYKKQCDRTLTIRLNKALQRAAVTLNQPHWSNLLPVDNEDSKLHIPEKGDKLLPSQIDMWLTVARFCLSDLQANINNISMEDYNKHMEEITNQLSQWSNRSQGPRADNRKS